MTATSSVVLFTVSCGPCDGTGQWRDGDDCDGCGGTGMVTVERRPFVAPPLPEEQPTAAELADDDTKSGWVRDVARGHADLVGSMSGRIDNWSNR